MRAVIEPTGCSVRCGAVQIRIDLFLGKKDIRYEEFLVPQEKGESIEAPFHSHFIQISPDTTDIEIKAKVQEVLNGFGTEFDKGGDLVEYWHRVKTPAYQPFKVNAVEEEAVFKELREDRRPANMGDDMALFLTRSAIKGLDIATRKDEFKVGK